MTPEERNLVVQLFDRLATLEDAERDPEAVRLIAEGLRQAPNAPYALVQTVLVQDEALKRADARIRALEGAAEPAAPDKSFLGGMRDGLFGKREGRGSVPSVRPSESASGMSPAWHNTDSQPLPSQGPPPSAMAPASAMGMGQGGSFLGTAAAAAAGMIGGSLLLSGIRSMMGGGYPTAHAAFDPGTGIGGGSPWGGTAAGGELAREVGLDDIARAPVVGANDRSGGQGLLDDSNVDDMQDVSDDDDPDDFDDGGFGGDDTTDI